MLGNFKGWELILILLLALLLFGGFKKLPDAARGIGRSLRIFKAETKGLADDDEKAADSAAAPAAPAELPAGSANRVVPPPSAAGQAAAAAQVPAVAESTRPSTNA